MATAELLVLRRNLIQLSSGSEPLEELGHFYDAVMSDSLRARKYFEAAMSKGAGESCLGALAALESESYLQRRIRCN